MKDSELSIIGNETVCGINSDEFRRFVDLRDTVSFDEENKVSSKYHSTGDFLPGDEVSASVICKKVVLSR